MQITLPNGQTRVHRSLTRSDRQLIMGCDREKFFDLLTLALPGVLVLPTFVAKYYGLVGVAITVVLTIITTIVGYLFLKEAGKISPYFYPIRKQAKKQQAVYYRSAHMRAKRRFTPRQQQP